MRTPVYINSAACISPQNTFDNEDYLTSNTEVLQTVPRSCVEPIYKEYINPRSLRRMGRMVRMGVCAAHKALKDAGVDNPDAILVGTGMGCLHDTEEFLTSIYTSNESIASPNQFIQSTHNNVAAQVAIMLKCYNYNFTYVHRGFSFESAMMDAILHVQEAGDDPVNLLVGASDELTDMYLKVTSKLNFWKPEQAIPNTKFNLGEGSQFGEGAAFFTVSNKKQSNALARLEGLQLIYKPINEEELRIGVTEFLSRHDIGTADIDLVMIGFDGGSDENTPFRRVISSKFDQVPSAMFKHLCGEYKTASAFGTWLSTEILRTQHIPEFVKLQDYSLDQINRILLINNYNNANFTLSLLSHV